MRASLCRLVPLATFVAAFLGVPGCADSHGLTGDAGRDASRPMDYLCECCPGRTVLTSGPDACPAACFALCEGPDAGPDAPIGSCGPRAIDLLCLDHVSAGRSTEVSITLAPSESDCFCGQEIICDAQITGPSTLSLTTQLCPETPICRACGGPPVGTCTLPAMTAGTWDVVVNGEHALDLDVLPPDVLPERADVCIRSAIVDSCGANWPAQPLRVGRACLDGWAPTGTRVPIRVYDECGGCNQRGPCEVTVVDDAILVRASTLPNACDIACPPVCRFDEHVCWTAPLPAGRYLLSVDGLPMSEPLTLNVSDTGGVPMETCSGEL